MKNKSLYHYTMMLILLGSGATMGCKKLVEIPANPPSEISATQEFADSATAMTAVAGVYSYPSNGSTNFTFNDGNLSLITGLSSDELTIGSPQADGQALYSYGLLPTNDIIPPLWDDPYKGVYPVNAVLSGVAASKGLSTSFKTQITAEMKVVRALYYFDLVNLFGGVPVVTSTDYATTDRQPRASVDSVYQQILDDLTAAQQVLPVTYPSSGHIRPNLYAVEAFLAKVYLYRQQWQAAYNAADSVISSGLYSLEPDPNRVFLDGSHEAIWQLPANGEYSTTTEAYNYVPQYTGAAPNYPIAPFLINAFEPGDLRMQDWVGVTVLNNGTGNQNVYYPFKYKNLLPSAPTVEDFMIFRLGEQYLIRAEAAAELGNLPTAIADLNTVRSRAGLGATSAVSQADILTAIMHERQVELFCEWGNRWLDLKRTGTAGTVLNAEKGNFQAYQALYPVPDVEIQANNLLTQNPGY